MSVASHPQLEQRKSGKKLSPWRFLFLVEDRKDFFLSSKRRKVPGGLGSLFCWLFSAAALAEHDQQPLEHAPDPPDGAAVGPIEQLGRRVLQPPCPL